jgi:hypothetical protein
VARLVHGLLLLERVDQIDGGEEADLLAVMLDGLDAERGGDVGLAGARPADQHDVVAPSMNSPRCSWRTMASLTSLEAKSKPGQILVGREAGGLDLVGDGPDLALGHLGLEQLGQDRHGGIEGGRALFDQIADGLGHAVHLEAAQHDHDGGAGGIMTHGASPSAGRRSARHWPWAPGRSRACGASIGGTVGALPSISRCRR